MSEYKDSRLDRRQFLQLGTTAGGVLSTLLLPGLAFASPNRSTAEISLDQSEVIERRLVATLANTPSSHGLELVETAMGERGLVFVRNGRSETPITDHLDSFGSEPVIFGRRQSIEPQHPREGLVFMSDTRRLIVYPNPHAVIGASALPGGEGFIIQSREEAGVITLATLDPYRLTPLYTSLQTMRDRRFGPVVTSFRQTDTGAFANMPGVYEAYGPAVDPGQDYQLASEFRFITRHMVRTDTKDSFERAFPVHVPEDLSYSKILTDFVKPNEIYVLWLASSVEDRNGNKISTILELDPPRNHLWRRFGLNQELEINNPTIKSATRYGESVYLLVDSKDLEDQERSLIIKVSTTQPQNQELVDTDGCGGEVIKKLEIIDYDGKPGFVAITANRVYSKIQNRPQSDWKTAQLV
ncbi:twin-arginine translocation signal domain-containing protein [Candidatus Daviesbacteria bacterium]|nr:twin-arginine translocation signal domain-containing protein [Candidatus Daviesbacteria bacterium]